MPYSVQAKDLMLAELASLAVYASAHDDNAGAAANPGSTGAYEAPGSTRAALTWGSPSAGAVLISGTPAISGIPSTFTVHYIGLWSASSGGTFYGYQPISPTSTTTGLPWTYTITAGNMNLNTNPSA